MIKFYNSALCPHFWYRQVEVILHDQLKVRFSIIYKFKKQKPSTEIDSDVEDDDFRSKISSIASDKETFSDCIFSSILSFSGLNSNISSELDELEDLILARLVKSVNDDAMVVSFSFFCVFQV